MKATARLWTVAQTEAAKPLEQEREALVAEKRAGDRILDETVARLDAAEAEAARVRALPEVLRTGGVSDPVLQQPSVLESAMSVTGASLDRLTLSG